MPLTRKSCWRSAQLLDTGADTGAETGTLTTVVATLRTGDETGVPLRLGLSPWPTLTSLTGSLLLSLFRVLRDMIKHLIHLPLDIELIEIPPSSKRPRHLDRLR